MTRILALTALLWLPLHAQEAPSVDRAAALVTADSLKKHLTVLAGDEYEGRCSGYPGNDKAAEYIANHFKKIGLRPAGEKNDKGEATYFQTFQVRERNTRNCLGLAEGSDPALKEEIVVIGAHYDHVGKDGQANAGRMKNKNADPDDKIWNGADDNGSGTVTVLEIARAFMEGKLRPKRSVLFMLFSGEEFGLLGSRHYVEHPLFPLEKTAAMINLDMVGRPGKRKLDVGGVSTAREWPDLLAKAAEGTGFEFTTSPGVTPGSDHYSFVAKRIPAVHFFTGFHADYHCQTDHADKIDYDAMEKIARFGLRLLVLTADHAGRMTPLRKLGIDTEEVSPERAKELGLKEDEGGISVMRVRENSVAGKAGLEEGDILVEFQGKKLPAAGPVAALQTWIQAVAEDADAILTVLRAGKRVNLKVRWPRKSY
jgi:hypothetical protein